MNITSRMSGNLQVLSVEETRIDAAAAIKFKDTIKDLTNAGSLDVVLDLEKVDFVDSSGLGAIVSIKKFLGPDRMLHLAALSPIVAKVFALTRMEKVFRIYPSAEDALDDPAKKRA